MPPEFLPAPGSRKEPALIICWLWLDLKDSLQLRGANDHVGIQLQHEKGYLRTCRRKRLLNKDLGSNSYGGGDR